MKCRTMGCVSMWGVELEAAAAVMAREWLCSKSILLSWGSMFAVCIEDTRTVVRKAVGLRSCAKKRAGIKRRTVTAATV